MNLETIRTQFTDMLNDHFTVQYIKAYMVQPSQLRPVELNGVPVIGIEVVFNHTMRLHLFGVERDGVLKFTRPKEGIKEFIIAELRYHDFYFLMETPLTGRYNLFARIIDTWLSYEGSEYIKNTVAFWCSESKNNLDYCLGYKIIQNHRHTKTFDAMFDVLINKRGTFHSYRGTIVNGQFVKATNEIGTVVTPAKLFEV